MEERNKEEKDNGKEEIGARHQLTKKSKIEEGPPWPQASGRR